LTFKLFAVLAVLAGTTSLQVTLAQTTEQRLLTCLACHGASGASKLPGVPSLGAMPADYVLTQLYMFREKMRVAAPMNALAEKLSDDDLRDLGDAVNKLPAPQPAGEALAAADQDHGNALVGRYHCNSCHGADLAGHDNIPRIAGQREDYLLKSLTDYKSGARPGYSPAMSEASKEIKPEDIPVLARFVASLR
jgi:cytochrome c553